MFEILMLCGFFYAATGCLLPEKTQGSGQGTLKKAPAQDKELETKKQHKGKHLHRRAVLKTTARFAQVA